MIERYRVQLSFYSSFLDRSSQIIFRLLARCYQLVSAYIAQKFAIVPQQVGQRRSGFRGDALNVPALVKKLKTLLANHHLLIYPSVFTCMSRRR